MKKHATDYPCPKCDAGPGAKCRNYLGKACAPHSGRLPKHVPNVQDLAEIEERVRVRQDIRRAALLAWTDAVSKCGHFAGARYGRWRLVDRTGARPDQLIYVVMRPGVSGWRDRQGRTVEDLDGDYETLGPPFLGFAPLGKDETAPHGFPFRWERRFEAIEVPEVMTAQELHDAARARREKALAKQETAAADLAAWKARNVPASLFADLPEESTP